MVRTGFGIACAALFGSLMFGCSTDVEDPGFTGGDETTTPTTDAPPASTTNDDETTASSESATSTSGKDTAGSTTTTGNDTAVDESSSGGDPTDDSSDTAAGCGDGVVSPGEQCDGADLQGFDCASLGLGTGSLGCDPVMCTFDTQMCESDTGGTSG